jgi:biotin carboxyl carrier protein
MIGKLLALGSAIALIGFGVLFDTVKLSSNAQPKSSPLEQPSKSPDNILLSTPSNKGGKLIKVDAVISEPADIKINPGQKIKAGDILADRTKERSQLEFQKQQLQNSLAQLNSYRIIEPTPPEDAPLISPLPDADYAINLAEINKARLKISLIQKQLGFAGATSNIAPDTVVTDIEDKKQKLVEAERLLEIQEKKVEQINLMGLPSYYNEHEQVKLAESLQAVELAKSDLSTSEAKSSEAINNNQSKLQELSIQLDLAQADLRLAESGLEKAKSERQKEEYDHTLTLARRIEESNQAKSFYEQERNKSQDSKRDLEYKKASIIGQINQVSEKLSAIAVVKSPFSGEVRRVKINGQTNNNLNATITIISTDDNAKSVSSSSTDNPFGN